MPDPEMAKRVEMSDAELIARSHLLTVEGANVGLSTHDLADTQKWWMANRVEVREELDRRAAARDRAAPPVKTEGPTLKEMAQACRRRAQMELAGIVELTEQQRRIDRATAEVLERLDALLSETWSVCPDDPEPAITMNKAIAIVRRRLGLPSEQRA